MAGINGLYAYQQTNQIWNTSGKKNEEVDKKTEGTMAGKTETGNKTSEWKPVSNNSLIPSRKEGIGMAIGDVKLSDKAKDYYSKLKSKFGNMEFIAVSSDMKAQVKANVASYGNANRMVVLIDDAKIEQMANDESFRKKYEGIIAMSQAQMAGAKNSLAGSGANVKNYGMSVNSDGTTKFFATIEKSSAELQKRIEKKQDKKKAEKKAEKAKEEKKSKEMKSKDDDENVIKEDKEYIKMEASSWEELLNMVSKYAYKNLADSIITDDEKNIGQLFDIKS